MHVGAGIIAAVFLCAGAVFGRGRMFQRALIVCWSIIVLPNVVTSSFADRISGGAGEAAGGWLLLSIFGGLFVLAPLTAGMILSLMMHLSSAP